MVDNDPNSANGSEAASPTLKSDQDHGNDRREKTTFKQLEEAKNRRDELIVAGGGWLRTAAIGLTAVIAVAIAFQLFRSDDSGAMVAEDASADFEPAPVTLQCDTVEEFAIIPDHPCNLKIQFQDKYRELSTQFLPLIEVSATEEFVQIGYAKILALEENAIKAFDRSDYVVAVRTVEDALQNARMITEAIADNFQSSLENANSAFLNNNADLAQEWIDRALRLNGQDTAALGLYNRIVVLPEIMALYQQAAAAEVQNQFSDLQKVLQKIIQLDPQRQDAAAQLIAVDEQLKQTRYNEHLRRASEYIKNEDTRAAKQEVNQADALYPREQDTSVLFARIDAIERSRRINAMLEDAQIMASQDNWPGVMERSEQILAEDSLNRAAINSREKANKIVSANNRVVNILNTQSRLQDAGVYQKTLEFVELIKPLAQDSKTLAASIATLEQRLELWQRKVKVTVHSDGKSRIIVRRVGRVGVIKEKDIMLRPGRYDFECSRDGYKSKIIEHFVAPGQSETTVTITCDVRI